MVLCCSCFLVWLVTMMAIVTNNGGDGNGDVDGGSACEDILVLLVTGIL